MSPSPRQLQILAFLHARRVPPSVREIADAVGLRSTSSAHHHLRKLQAVGLIQWEEGRSRGVTVVGPTRTVPDELRALATVLEERADVWPQDSSYDRGWADAHIHIARQLRAQAQQEAA